MIESANLLHHGGDGRSRVRVMVSFCWTMFRDFIAFHFATHFSTRQPPVLANPSEKRHYGDTAHRSAIQSRAGLGETPQTAWDLESGLSGRQKTTQDAATSPLCIYCNRTLDHTMLISTQLLFLLRAF